LSNSLQVIIGSKTVISSSFKITITDSSFKITITDPRTKLMLKAKKFQSEKVSRRSYFDRFPVTTATCSLCAPFPFPSDDSSDGGINDMRINQKSIQEGDPEDNTVKGDEMDEDTEELTENGNLTKCHIIMHFDGNGQKTNIGFLLKEVFKWWTSLDPELYLETANANWKTIKTVEDFPTKETNFVKCFPPPTLEAAAVPVFNPDNRTN
jgi:hypothetical protein